MEQPLILVTNDDGITANGIRALVDVVTPLGEVVVMAPDRPQSGMGHAITVNDPLRLNASDVFNGEQLKAYSCTGTPVDCVKLAMFRLLDRKPDLIVSGVNHGSNCSTNVLYSGTMSAAVEGALNGIPSIGFSLLDHDPEADFEPAKPFMLQVIKQVLEHGTPEDVCLNVNIPKTDEIKGVKVCRQARAFWDDGFHARLDNFNREYFWLAGKFRDHDGGDDSDIVALEKGFISVVPTQFDLTAHHAMAKLNNWNWDVEKG